MQLSRCTTQNLLRDILLTSTETRLVELQAELEYLLAEVKQKRMLLDPQTDTTKRSWPAFYILGDSVLWVSISGRVVNGAWLPEYSDDKNYCWQEGYPEQKFRWTAPAPHDGPYNKVIDRFQAESAILREDYDDVHLKEDVEAMSQIIEKAIQTGKSRREKTER